MLNINKFIFPTVFGRNTLEELKYFVNVPFLVVTMEDLWPQIKEKLEGSDHCVYFVKSTDETILQAALKEIPDVQAFVGIGGGQAIDVAKYFAWRSNKPLFQIPTILSVDAMYGHRSGVRHQGKVFYVGWAVPECIFFDYDLIQSAPPRLNHSGIGDILCFHTGVLDWQYAEKRNKNSQQFAYREELAEISLAKVENVLSNITEIRDLTEKGIQVLVDGFMWGGASFMASGWCPCHVEGMEHFFFYNLEYKTQKNFLHGQPVSLGVYIGSMMHNFRAGEMLRAIAQIGLDIRPQAMGLSWQDVHETMADLQQFVIERNLSYSIVHEQRCSQELLAEIQTSVNAAYSS